MVRHTLQAFSLFPYFSKQNANTDEKKRLQQLLWALKDGRSVQVGAKGTSVPATEWFAGVLRDAKHIPAGFLGENVTVVPIPSSSLTPNPPNRAAWPMYDLALHLMKNRIVANASSALVRRTAVPKGHLTAAAQRPSVGTHATSMSADLSGVGQTNTITLLDDVLTTGTSAIGAAQALRQAGYRGDIRVLTATHTVGAEYSRQQISAAKSEIVWLEGSKDRAWRPSEDVEYVD